jgi:hypothetical protein
LNKSCIKIKKHIYAISNVNIIKRRGWTHQHYSVTTVLFTWPRGTARGLASNHNGFPYWKLWIKKHNNLLWFLTSAQ